MPSGFEPIAVWFHTDPALVCRTYFCVGRLPALGRVFIRDR